MTAAQIPNFQAGDRFPNFLFPDQSGNGRDFYAEVAGKPVVFLVTQSLSDGTGKIAARTLAEKNEELAKLDLEIFSLCGEVPAQAAFGLAAVKGKWLCFTDPAKEAVKPLLEAASATLRRVVTSALFVLDANQRVLAIYDAAETVRLVGRVIEEIKTWRGRQGDGMVLAQAAPVLILPNLVPPTMCRRLIELWRKEHHEGGVSDGTKNIYSDRKKTLEHLIGDVELNQEIARLLARRVGPELSKAFAVTPRYRFEAFIVMRYGEERGDYFGLHRDRYTPSHPRRFALSLNLNEGYEGGELVFPEYGPHRFRPPAGGGAVFSCSLLHQALPVTRGERFVMTAFFNEAGEQQQGRAQQRAG